MKSLISMSVCFAILAVAWDAEFATAQDASQSSEVQSVVKNKLSQEENLDASSADEDVPPPLPVPDTEVAPEQPTQDSFGAVPRGREVRAYDFGISYVSTQQGLRVIGVVVGSSAAAAGVQPNDLIARVNGNPASGGVLQREVIETLEVIRNGARETLSVRSAETPRVSNSPSNRAAGTAPSTPRNAAPAPRYAPRTVYQTRPYTYRRYYSTRPRVSVGYGTGFGYGPYGPYRGYGYGPGVRYGYGRGVGVGYTRGFGRSGFSIRIGF